MVAENDSLPKPLHLEMWREPHIGIEREPDFALERRRRPYTPQRRSRNPRIHGDALSQSLDTSVTEVVETRKRVGVDPERLLVVEFQSWDPACREVMEERFGAFVLDERMPHTGNDAGISNILVQFPSKETIDQFQREAEHYRSGRPDAASLPAGLRRQFFDCLETVRAVSSEERYGARLRREGLPDRRTFALDADIWSPETDDENRRILREFRELCNAHGGLVTEHLQTSSLILARVKATRELAEILLDLDVVAQVNLPPVLPAMAADIFQKVPAPPQIQPDGNEPLITVVDSGVLPGHALLRGWILDERDFNTGEGTAVDQQGHGTQVAGLAMYGSVARCLSKGIWVPDTLVASAKVLVKDPNFPDRAMFPEHHRPELLVEQAIRHFHTARNCRVFNLSVGNPDDVYAGGRQWPWAEVLDRLARELDIVIVVAAGNNESPPIPDLASNRVQLQEKVRDMRLTNAESRVTSPATSSIAVTVGAIARSAKTRIAGSVAGAPEGAPAPFSRIGPGYENKSTQYAVKPEFVAYGGNLAITNLVGTQPVWGRDPHLGEPTTRLNSDGGRPLTAAVGTSFAAPQVANAAAWALESASEVLGASTANDARALLGACAETPPCGNTWLLDSERKETADRLRLAGFGIVDRDRVRTSLANNTCLIASDEVDEDHWHVYELPIPSAFLAGKGERGMSIALAFDPPVRSSRRQYLARTMWQEVMKGLTLSEIIKYRARHVGPGKPLRLPASKLLSLRPAKADLQWSTLQVRRKAWRHRPVLPIPSGANEPSIHLLVGCQKRFPHGEGPNQRYSIAVRFWHSDAQINLYQQLQSRVRTRTTVPARLERRV